MKTIEQWFNELPEPYRSQALENVDEQQKKMMCENMKGAINIFSWTYSPQGTWYWLELYNTFLL